jgi:hypothetical protein
MAGSRLGSQYALGTDRRQFATAAEDVTYVDSTGATIALKCVVTRELKNPPNDVRPNGDVYQIQRASLEVLPYLDTVNNGIVLDTSDKLAALKGRNFSIGMIDGGPLVPDWIVHQISGGVGTWTIDVSREKRVETGKTRR